MNHLNVILKREMERRTIHCKLFKFPDIVGNISFFELKQYKV